MAKNNRKSTRTVSRFNFSSFIGGIVVGCLASIVVAATAIPILDDYQPDTVAFPEIRESERSYEYEFPTLLEADRRTPDRVESVADVPATSESATPRSSAEASQAPAGYLLQAGSFEIKDRADAFRAALMLRGYQAVTSQTNVQGVGTRFRVVIGPFKTQGEAESAISRLKEEQVDAMLLEFGET